MKKILLFPIIVLFLTFGCILPEKNVEELQLPNNIVDKFYELKDKYEGSEFPVVIEKCENEEENLVYILHGSGGYAGELHFYTETGEYLGVQYFDDYSAPDEPPIDVSDYECYDLLNSN